MILQIHIKPKVLDFGYHDELVDKFHFWNRHQNDHNDLSLYSYSWIRGVRQQGDKLVPVAKYMVWTVGLHQGAEKFVKAIASDPEVLGSDVYMLTKRDPLYKGRDIMQLTSPVLLKKEKKFLKPFDPGSDEIINRIMKKKIAAAGLDGELEMHFFAGGRSKLINISSINNKAHFGMVNIKGDPQLVEFARTVGIGHSTGCGFGALI